MAADFNDCSLSGGRPGRVLTKEGASMLSHNQAAVVVWFSQQ